MKNVYENFYNNIETIYSFNLFCGLQSAVFFFLLKTFSIWNWEATKIEHLKFDSFVNRTHISHPAQSKHRRHKFMCLKNNTYQKH